MNTFVRKCIYNSAGKTFLNIKTKPGSKKEGIVSIDEDQIVVSIKAAPIDGKANKDVIEYFSDILKISKSDIQIEKGTTNKNKTLSINFEFKEEDLMEIFKNNLI